MLAVDFVVTYLVVDQLCIKIANKVDKKFAMETEAKQIVLKVVRIDEIDGVNEVDGVDRVDGIDTVDRFDEFDGIEKYRKIVLL